MPNEMNKVCVGNMWIEISVLSLCVSLTLLTLIWLMENVRCRHNVLLKHFYVNLGMTTSGLNAF